MTDVVRPFFESPGDLRSSQPRLLLISYHFPPSQTAGALRWEKFPHYAAERGWAMDVVTLHPSSLSNLDTSRLAALPAGIRVYGVPDPVLWVEHVERSVWRGYRRIRPATEAAGVDGSQAGAGAAVLGGSRSASRSHSLGRAEMRWTSQDLPRRTASRVLRVAGLHPPGPMGTGGRESLSWPERSADLRRRHQLWTSSHGS